MIITGDENSKGIQLYKKYETLKSSRHNWQNHWDEISTYVMPKKDNIYGFQVVGEKKSNRLYDTYAITALENMTSGLHGMLTNPSTVWFGLTSGDSDKDQLDAVQKYLQTAVDVMINAMNQSNFQTEIYEVFLDLGSFGTSVLRVEKDEQDLLRFKAIPIYECVIAENERSVIDTTFYEYDMTVENIVKMFPDTVTEDVKEKAAIDPSQKIKILHVVQPSANIDISGGKKITSQAFESTHILSTTKTVLKEAGFNENPHIVPRWSKVSGEIYGRSPAMKSLADIKMGNKMKKATIEGAQLAVAPPTQAPDDGVILPLDLRPRGINFYRAGTKDRIEPINIAGNVNLGEALIEQVHANIDRAFFLDKLQIREADRMTATEIVQRRDEQLRTLGPILGRQHHELLKPLIERVFNILERAGKMPDIPTELKDTDLQVLFTSQIAKAQRSAEGDSFSKTMQLVLPVVEIAPEIMDNFDVDAIARFAANIHGLPHEILMDKDARDARRKERAAQEAELREQEANLNEAEVVNKVTQ